MSKLSLNVFSCVLQSMQVEELPRLSLVDRECRFACLDKTLWKRIFTKHGLVILEEAKSVTSWVFNFQSSLVSKRLVDDLMEKLDKIHTVAAVIGPVKLRLIKDTSTIHIPGVTDERELDMLICKDRFCHLGDKNGFKDKLFRDVNNKYTLDTRVKSAYIQLHIRKEQQTYYMVISETSVFSLGIEEIEHVNHKLGREQVTLLFYKLSYYSLLTVHRYVERSLMNAKKTKGVFCVINDNISPFTRLIARNT
ncbi:F-box domain-containing protein [Cedratvirus Zaza IHUMI]|uniref:F-box domain-containing protein n=1 Tax=Cedratvirus Zaza IHUMI TaxID=2126979 RepID=A0A2R8FEQ3_9VIRU|nr:F-box domain-containing protein [Cedratvirus Zaza IHUMI]